MRPLAIAYGNNRQAKVSIAVEEHVLPVLSLSQTNKQQQLRWQQNHNLQHPVT